MTTSDPFRRMAPRLGENSREVLEQFGFGEAEVASLLDGKAVVQHTRADMAVLQQNAKGDATIPNDASFDLKNALALPDATTVTNSTAPVRGFAFFDLADTSSWDRPPPRCR